MRRRVIVASSVAAAVAATGAAVTAAQASQDAQTRSSGTAAPSQAARQLIVVERAVTDTLVDLGPRGDSRGDLLAFGNPVFNRTNSKRIGSDQGSCIRTVVGRSWECSWTTRLAKGSLVVEGTFFDTRDSALAITGGTGIYSRARGVMHLHARNARGTAYTFKFTVQN